METLNPIDGSIRTGAAMNDVRLTDELACKVMGWRPTPDRFIKSGRSWIPRWRFTPLTRLDDAFQLLDRFASSYKLEKTGQGSFAVEVQFNDRVGKASGEPKARAITLAVARTLGLEVPQ